jgi:glycogen operon protein
MTKRDWDESHVVGMFLNGEEIAAPDEQGERVVDDSFLLLFNGSHEHVEFKLPPTRFGRRWNVVLRTDDPEAEPGAVQASAGELMGLPHLSLMVLQREN